MRTVRISKFRHHTQRIDFATCDKCTKGFELGQDIVRGATYGKARGRSLYHRECFTDAKGRPIYPPLSAINWTTASGHKVTDEEDPSKASTLPTRRADPYASQPGRHLCRPSALARIVEVSE